jgi:hypothetical protein
MQFSHKPPPPFHHTDKCLAVEVNKDIIWVDVAMDDVHLFVKVLQGEADLHENLVIVKF